jgi:hypothetical protein
MLVLWLALVGIGFVASSLWLYLLLTGEARAISHA